MWVYVCIALFPSILGCLFPDISYDRRAKRRYLIICGIVLLIFMGLRSNSLGSTDTLNYYNQMKRAISCRTWSEYKTDVFEYGAQALFFLLSRVCKEPQGILIFSSAFYIVSIFYFVSKNSDDIPLSISMYITMGLFMFHLQGMRQSIAMCICLFAYEFAKNRKIIGFIITVLLAASVHQTAIVFLPVYYIAGMDFNRKNIILSAGASIALIAFADRIASFANYWFDMSYTRVLTSGGFITLFFYIAVIVIVYIYNENILEEKHEKTLFYIFVLGTVCFMARYVGAAMAERISYYFLFPIIVLLPKMQAIIVEDQRNLYKMGLLLITVVFFIHHLSGSSFIPYMFFWQS